MIVFQAKQAVHGIGRVVLVCVVHKVEHHEIFLAFAEPHSPAQLLQIEHLRHGRSRHEQHFRLGAIPALVQKVAGAQDF